MVTCQEKTRPRYVSQRGHAFTNLATCPPLCFSSVFLYSDIPQSVQSERSPADCDRDSSALASNVLAIPPTPREPGTMDLACEWYNLNAAGLSQYVINTIQSGRVAITSSFYI